MDNQIQQPDRFLREREVRNVTGLSRTTRWRMENENNFPKRRQISTGAVGWKESEIQAWVADRQAVETAPA